MTRAHERLWKDLISRLRARGVIDHSPMTPGEVASAATAVIGDDRVARFVEDYYLPRTYGSNRGQLTRDEAEELLASLDELPQPETEGPWPGAPGNGEADDRTRRGRRDRRLEVLEARLADLDATALEH